MSTTDETALPYWGLSYDERQQFVARVLTGLTGLHEHLGDGWTAHYTEYGNWELTGPEAERLRLRVDEGRIVVNPQPPVGVDHWRDLKRDEVPQRITLSPAKTHPQLARDIHRRVLDRYTPLVERELKLQQAYDDEVAARDATVVELYRVLSAMGTPRAWGSGRGGNVVGVCVDRRHYGQDLGSIAVEDMSVHTRYEDKVSLRVPRHKLVEVCAAVAAILGD